MNEYFMVNGYASVEIKDHHGDIILIDSLINAMPKFMYQNSTLNYEHSVPIGKIIGWERTEKNGRPAMKITAILHDNYLTDEIKQKVKNNELNAFSVRGSALQAMNNVITELEIYEISLVSEPANPEAKLTDYRIIKSIVKSRCQDNRTGFVTKLKEMSRVNSATN